jgi:hypothetical protein
MWCVICITKTDGVLLPGLQWCELVFWGISHMHFWGTVQWIFWCTVPTLRVRCKWSCFKGLIQVIYDNVCVRLQIVHAKAQAVSRWLPTVVDRVLSWVKSCGICGGQSITGAGFLQVLWFSMPLIHSTNCSTFIIIYHPGLVQQANKWSQ